ncbi:MAG TPA: hypothetical protein VHR66_10330 [Gemmataceae bacterium]|nr:hypothetical protein [Gemmataceae bacterium]
MLRLLCWTPASTALLHRASPTFDGGGFIDERRLRERLQSLQQAKIVRTWPMAQAGGGLQNYYKLTPLGFAFVGGRAAAQPSRAFFAEVSPSLLFHTFRLAEVIVETLRACHANHIHIDRFFGENGLSIVAGDRQVQPDCFFRLRSEGRSFNLAIEIDNSTASVDSHAVNSIRQKLTTYNAYQELVLNQWHQAGKSWERPRFRVVFLTPSDARAHNILALAAEGATRRARRLVYAATFDVFVADPDRLSAPIFLDHFGHWQSLVDLHPEVSPVKPPVRLSRLVDCLLTAC